MLRKLALLIHLQYKAFQDKGNQPEWRVESVDSSSGNVFVTIFSGPLAKERAIEYSKFKNNQ